MTNKEAIEYGKKWDRAIESRGDTLFSEARQFLNLAINALEERPQGQWIYREEWFEDEEKPRMTWGCNLCGHSIRSVHEKLNFCSNCGAAMQKGG